MQRHSIFIYNIDISKFILFNVINLWWSIVIIEEVTRLTFSFRVQWFVGMFTLSDFTFSAKNVIAMVAHTLCVMLFLCVRTIAYSALLSDSSPNFCLVLAVFGLTWLYMKFFFSGSHIYFSFCNNFFFLKWITSFDIWVL